MITMNRLPNDVVSSKYICYYVQRFNNGPVDTLMLREVRELILRHPDAPEDATITDIEIVDIKDVKSISKDAASLILLEAAENNVRNIRLGELK